MFEKQPCQLSRRRPCRQPLISWLLLLFLLASTSPTGLLSAPLFAAADRIKDSSLVTQLDFLGGYTPQGQASLDRTVLDKGAGILGPFTLHAPAQWSAKSAYYGADFVNEGPQADPEQWQRLAPTLSASASGLETRVTASGGLTVEFWLSRTTTDADLSALFSIGTWTSSSAANDAVLVLYQSLATLQLNVKSASGTEVVSIFDFPAVGAAPAHVVLTVEKVTAPQSGLTIACFINGDFTDMTEYYFPVAGMALLGNRMIYIAPSPLPTPSGAPVPSPRPHSWSGSVHYFALYSRALTFPEAVQNYGAAPVMRQISVGDVNLPVLEHQSAQLQWIPSQALSHPNAVADGRVSLTSVSSDAAACVKIEIYDVATSAYIVLDSSVLGNARTFVAHNSPLRVSALGSYTACLGKDISVAFRARIQQIPTFTADAYVRIGIKDDSPPSPHTTASDTVKAWAYSPLQAFTGANADASIRVPSAALVTGPSSPHVTVYPYSTATPSEVDLLKPVTSTTGSQFLPFTGGSNASIASVYYNVTAPYSTMQTGATVDSFTVGFTVTNELGKASSTGTRTVRVTNWLLPVASTLDSPVNNVGTLVLPFSTPPSATALLPVDMHVIVVQLPPLGTLSAIPFGGSEWQAVVAGALPFKAQGTSLRFRAPDGFESDRNNPVATSFVYKVANVAANITSFVSAAVGIVVRPVSQAPSVTAPSSIQFASNEVFHYNSSILTASSLDVKDWYGTSFSMVITCNCLLMSFKLNTTSLTNVTDIVTGIGQLRFSVYGVEALRSALANVLIEPLSFTPTPQTTTYTLTEKSSLGSTAVTASSSVKVTAASSASGGDATAGSSNLVTFLLLVILVPIAGCCGICIFLRYFLKMRRDRRKAVVEENQRLASLEDKKRRRAKVEKKREAKEARREERDRRRRGRRARLTSKGGMKSPIREENKVARVDATPATQTDKNDNGASSSSNGSSGQAKLRPPPPASPTKSSANYIEESKAATPMNADQSSPQQARKPGRSAKDDENQKSAASKQRMQPLEIEGVAHPSAPFPSAAEAGAEFEGQRLVLLEEDKKKCCCLFRMCIWYVDADDEEKKRRIKWEKEQERVQKEHEMRLRRLEQKAREREERERPGMCEMPKDGNCRRCRCMCRCLGRCLCLPVRCVAALGRGIAKACRCLCSAMQCCCSVLQTCLLCMRYVFCWPCKRVRPKGVYVLAPAKAAVKSPSGNISSGENPAKVASDVTTVSDVTIAVPINTAEGAAKPDDSEEDDSESGSEYDSSDDSDSDSDSNNASADDDDEDEGGGGKSGWRRDRERYARRTGRRHNSARSGTTNKSVQDDSEELEYSNSDDASLDSDSSFEAWQEYQRYRREHRKLKQQVRHAARSAQASPLRQAAHNPIGSAAASNEGKDFDDITPTSPSSSARTGRGAIVQTLDGRVWTEIHGPWEEQIGQSATHVANEDHHELDNTVEDGVSHVHSGSASYSSESLTRTLHRHGLLNSGPSDAGKAARLQALQLSPQLQRRPAPLHRPSSSVSTLSSFRYYGGWDSQYPPWGIPRVEGPPSEAGSSHSYGSETAMLGAGNALGHYTSSPARGGHTHVKNSIVAGPGDEFGSRRNSSSSSSSGINMYNSGEVSMDAHGGDAGGEGHDLDDSTAGLVASNASGKKLPRVNSSSSFVSSSLSTSSSFSRSQDPAGGATGAGGLDPRTNMLPATPQRYREHHPPVSQQRYHYPLTPPVQSSSVTYPPLAPHELTPVAHHSPQLDSLSSLSLFAGGARIIGRSSEHFHAAASFNMLQHQAGSSSPATPVFRNELSFGRLGGHPEEQLPPSLASMSSNSMLPQQASAPGPPPRPPARRSVGPTTPQQQPQPHPQPQPLPQLTPRADPKPMEAARLLPSALPTIPSTSPASDEEPARVGRERRDAEKESLATSVNMRVFNMTRLDDRYRATRQASVGAGASATESKSLSSSSSATGASSSSEATLSNSNGASDSVDRIHGDESESLTRVKIISFRPGIKRGEPVTSAGVKHIPLPSSSSSHSTAPSAPTNATPHDRSSSPESVPAVGVFPFSRGSSAGNLRQSPQQYSNNASACGFSGEPSQASLEYLVTPSAMSMASLQSMSMSLAESREDSPMRNTGNGSVLATQDASLQASESQAPSSRSSTSSARRQIDFSSEDISASRVNDVGGAHEMPPPTPPPFASAISMKSMNPHALSSSFQPDYSPPILPILRNIGVTPVRMHPLPSLPAQPPRVAVAVDKNGNNNDDVEEVSSALTMCTRSFAPHASPAPAAAPGPPPASVRKTERGGGPTVLPPGGLHGSAIDNARLEPPPSIERGSVNELSTRRRSMGTSDSHVAGGGVRQESSPSAIKGVSLPPPPPRPQRTPSSSREASNTSFTFPDSSAAPSPPALPSASAKPSRPTSRPASRPTTPQAERPTLAPSPARPPASPSFHVPPPLPAAVLRSIAAQTPSSQSGVTQRSLASDHSPSSAVAQELASPIGGTSGQSLGRRQSSRKQQVSTPPNPPPPPRVQASPASPVSSLSPAVAFGGFGAELSDADLAALEEHAAALEAHIRAKSLAVSAGPAEGTPQKKKSKKKPSKSGSNASGASGHGPAGGYDDPDMSFLT